MWFEGTYTPRGSSCLSSRLLVTWNQRVPNVFLEHLEDAWRPTCRRAFSEKKEAASNSVVFTTPSLL